MNYRKRIYYNYTQKALIWDRWQQGESLQQIAQLFDRNHSSIQGILAEYGGIRPPQRRRAVRTLSLTEREEISRGVVGGCSIRAMAISLRRAPSTICRELHRNGGRSSYRASHADEAAWSRAQRPKVCKLAFYIQSRGALKKELLSHLRRTRAMRRSRLHTQKTDNHGRIIGAVPISERPSTVADRAVPGHWEGDLVFGSHNSQIATLVERQTRYAMLVKVDGKDTATVVNALIRNARRLPKELYRSPTRDRGKELAAHQRFTLATDIQVYFCDPHKRWQRGSNENTNGLLRQYLPKGLDLSNISQAELNVIARRLNERSRKTPGYETPAERYRQCVASTS